MKAFSYTIPALGIFFFLSQNGIHMVSEGVFIELIKEAEKETPSLHPFAADLVRSEWTMKGTCLGDLCWPQAHSAVRVLLGEGLLEAKWVGDDPGVGLISAKSQRIEAIVREIKAHLPALWSDVEKIAQPLVERQGEWVV
jgi:hypothetical protein